MGRGQKRHIALLPAELFICRLKVAKKKPGQNPPHLRKLSLPVNTDTYRDYEFTLLTVSHTFGGHASIRILRMTQKHTADQ